jgi:hypothetical protein
MRRAVENDTGSLLGSLLQERLHVFGSVQDALSDTHTLRALAAVTEGVECADGHAEVRGEVVGRPEPFAGFLRRLWRHGEHHTAVVVV